MSTIAHAACDTLDRTGAATAIPRGPRVDEVRYGRVAGRHGPGGWWKIIGAVEGEARGALGIERLTKATDTPNQSSPSTIFAGHAHGRCDRRAIVSSRRTRRTRRCMRSGAIDRLRPRALDESGSVQGFLPTERRWNRNIQAEGCSALPVVKTGCVTDSPSLSRTHSGLGVATLGARRRTAHRRSSVSSPDM
jgi:hypothetical protein